MKRCFKHFRCHFLVDTHISAGYDERSKYVGIQQICCTNIFMFLLVIVPVTCRKRHSTNVIVSFDRRYQSITSSSTVSSNGDSKQIRLVCHRKGAAKENNLKAVKQNI